MMLSFTYVVLSAAMLASVSVGRPMRAEGAIFPRQTPSPGSTCYSGVYLIVARGSEEDPGEGKPGEVADMVVAQVPNSGSVAVNYPASIADPPYPESVSDGITDTINKIQSYVTACGSSSKIALVGYSQGGTIMTDTLAGGVDKPAPLASSYAQYSMTLSAILTSLNANNATVTAVTVFGDPSYTTGQSFDVGNATQSGIFARGGSSLAQLNTYASILQSYCMANDPFCASGDDEDVHSAEVGTFASAATAFIVSKNN